MNSARSLLLTVAALLLTAASACIGRAAIWSNPSPGDLLQGSNWSGGVAPNGYGETAWIYPANPSAPGNFTLDGAMTLNLLYYENGGVRTLSGVGTLAMEGTPLVTAQIAQVQGALTIGHSDAFYYPMVQLNSATGFNIQSGSELVVNSQITGPGMLVKTGPQTLRLRQFNTHLGGTYIFQGQVITNDTHALAAGDVFIDNGASLRVEYGHGSAHLYVGSLNGFAGAEVLLPGGTTIEAGYNNASGTFHGVISGPLGSLWKVGTGTLTLGGVSTYTGGTNISGGTLRLENGPNRLPTSIPLSMDTWWGASVLDLNGFSQTIGSLQSYGSGSMSVLLGTGTLTTGGDNTSTTFSGSISGPGNLSKMGAGTFTLSGVSTYTGFTAVSNGILRFAGHNRLSPLTAVTVWSPASMELDGFDQAVGSLAGSGYVALGGGTLTVGGNNYNTTFSGNIDNAGRVTKVDSGTLTLSGPQWYAGNTTVLSGALNVTGILSNNGPDKVFIAADASGTGAFNAGSLVRATTPLGNIYAGIGSTSIGGLGSAAKLLAGQRTAPNGSVGMAWRVRTNAEQSVLASNVLRLSDMNDGLDVPTDPFVLQMDFDGSSVEYLGWFDGANWVNAVAGNYVEGAYAWPNYAGSWNDFKQPGEPGDGHTLGSLLGSWGVDAANNVAWAVLDHNSQFAAAVPEPGTYVMLVIGALALTGRGWRRRRRA